jgi:hypothetical protein
MRRALLADEECRPLPAASRAAESLDSVAHIDGEKRLEAQNQPAIDRAREVRDARRQPRFPIKVKITIRSRTGEVLEGETVDISESGISSMLKIEVPLGELVELAFTLPFGQVKIYAMVRQRSAFRYGFQFVESNGTDEVIHATCSHLAVKRNLLGEF